MATKYETLLNQLEEYFCNLLILQYRKVPKNRALVKYLVDLVFANCLAQQIADLTVNINDSVGAQLDVVGKWLGIDRYYSNVFIWDKKYFSMPSYSQIKNNSYEDAQGPFALYSNFTDEGAVLQWTEWQSTHTKVYSLGDSQFRQMCKLKAIKNSIRCTMKNIDNAIYEWSNGEVYTTWGKMELTYHYPSSYSQIFELAQEKNVLPQPTGVALLFEEITE